MPAFGQVRGNCEVTASALAALEDAAPCVVFTEVGFDKHKHARFSGTAFGTFERIGIHSSTVQYSEGRAARMDAGLTASPGQFSG